jgi:hypothetical protein
MPSTCVCLAPQAQVVRPPRLAGLRKATLSRAERVRECPTHAIVRLTHRSQNVLTVSSRQYR